MIHRCRCCDRYRETRRAMKYGNETARRAGQWRYAQICEACARDAVRFLGMSVDRNGNAWRLRRAWPEIKES